MHHRAGAAIPIRVIGLVLSGLAILLAPHPASANPKGGQVTAGSATISNSSPIQVDITQSTDRAVIDWQSFNIAVGERTRFQQPAASSWTLNRVHAADPSTIAGQLNANGSLVLVNPNGVVFSKGSQVNVNSIIATPSDIGNANFMAGNMRFDKPSPNPNARVVNQGTITVAERGLAALVAPGVANSGMIQAKLGKVVLAGAETFTLDFYGDGLINFDIGPKVATVPIGPDGRPVKNLVSNTGTIAAPGGTVLLTADAVSGILENVIDSSGTLMAQTAPAGAGKVTIDARPGNAARLSGLIDVSGTQPGQRGGTAIVTGGSARLASTARIDARGRAGGGTVRIGGGAHGADASVRNAQNTTIDAGAVIDASATENGNGGNVVVWSDGSTVFNGTIYARGGALGGNGGWVETSGQQLGAGPTALVDALAPNGKAGDWVLDPRSITVQSGGTGTLAQAADTSDTTTALTVDPATINSAAANVHLQATDFVTFASALNLASPGISLNVHAGGPVSVNAPITTSNGDFTVQGFNGATSAGSFANTAAINVGTANININTSGPISLGSDLKTTGSSFTTSGNPGAGTVTLVSGDAINQTGGLITADVLTGNSVGGASLNSPNKVNFFGTFSNANSGLLSFTNAQSLRTGTISVASDLTLQNTAGDLTLGSLTVPGTLTLNSAGDIRNSFNTLRLFVFPVNAGTLTGSAAVGMELIGPNQIRTLGSFTGNLSLTNSVPLTQAAGTTINAGLGSININNSGAAFDRFR